MKKEIEIGPRMSKLHDILCINYKKVGFGPKIKFWGCLRDLKHSILIFSKRTGPIENNFTFL